MEKYRRLTPDGWKYCKSQIGEDELYNLNEDPNELNNLISDNVYRELVCVLNKKIAEWCNTHSIK